MGRSSCGDTGLSKYRDCGHACCFGEMFNLYSTIALILSLILFAAL